MNIQEALFIATATKKVIKLYIKKEQALIDAAFYVLLSARWATLQKITVLLTQAKTDSQAGARKKCQAKDIYFITCLLPLITQHYSLCSVQLQLKMLWVRKLTEEVEKQAMRVEAGPLVTLS